MKETEMIIQMAQENNGTVTAAMVTKAGISRGTLKYLTDAGKLERSGRGVYVLLCKTDSGAESFLVIQLFFFGT